VDELEERLPERDGVQTPLATSACWEG
jgi:hypothetical protein